MTRFDTSWLLRFPVIVIMLAHGLPGMFDNSISDFGKGYLDPAGFAPLGIYVAWLIKLSHVGCAICLLVNRLLTPACLVTIFILIVGIFMVHLPDGWYVVGGGRNGVEFNFLLIFVLLSILFSSSKSRLFRNPAEA